MTDNGNAYRSTIHALACKSLGIKHLRTRPYRPRTNGKAERFIRTLLGGWAYGAIYRKSDERRQHSPAGSTSTIDDDHTAASAAKPRSSAYTRSTGTTSSGLHLDSGEVPLSRRCLAAQSRISIEGARWDLGVGYQLEPRPG